MKYIIELDDNTNAGKHLVGLIKSLLTKGKGIEMLSEAEIEKREDLLLGKMMVESKKTGLANKKEVLTRLNL